jgi:hypothetical protein
VKNGALGVRDQRNLSQRWLGPRMVRAGSARHLDPLVLGGHERSRPVNKDHRSHGVHRSDLDRRISPALSSNPTSGPGLAELRGLCSARMH